ncbi:hypothetical protein C8R45DRAFT_1157938 [Mycena sanguinolenta]|nr:hypothetical protein C8R45DRAFT_1157938 [Mycena sanguinolenta]
MATTASFWSKLIVLPGLTVSTAAAILLLIASKHDSTALYTFVTEHPTQTQVLLQVTAHLLGFIHIFTLSTIINLSTRLRLRQGSISLAQLRLWHSVSSIKVAFNLPFLHYGILLGYLFLHLLPALLWAAALAPIPSQTTSAGSLRLPAYPPDPSQMFWNQPSGARVADVTRNEKGVFTYTPAATLQAGILNSASAATGITGAPVHAKNDYSHLFYVGRSYGVGASAGLAAVSLDSDVDGQQTPLQYLYQELGYMTSVNCWHNESSAWGLHLWANRTSPAFPTEFLACGVLPNSPYQAGKAFTDSDCPGLIVGFKAEWYAVLNIGDGTSAIFALVGRTNAARHMFALAAGTGPYNALNKIQCEAHFVPQAFQVLVNMTSSLITVTPMGNSTVDIDSSAATYGAGLGLLPQAIMGQVTYLSQAITDLYNSVIGDTFISNVQNAALAAVNTTVNDTSVVFSGVSAALESMIDDLLVGVASAQLEIAGQNSSVIGATTTTSTTISMAAMRLGTFEYVVLIATLNFLIVALYCEELVRTKVWQGLPLFDYNDIASVVVAVSRGGEELGLAVASVYAEDGKVWPGDSDNMKAADTRMLLSFPNGMPKIAAVGPLSGTDEEQAYDSKSDTSRSSLLAKVQATREWIDD